MTYQEFLLTRASNGSPCGFVPIWIPDYLFDFQRSLVDWAIRMGRCALFEDCGLGKTPQQLVWAENIVRRTNRPALIIAPLAVTAQTEREAAKFGIAVKRSTDGRAHANITITNYEQLHKFSPQDFAGVVCDESSILKSFTGEYRSRINEFMRKVNYRLLATATAAPNDYIELGTSSEALGYLGYIDMLNRFFKNDNNTTALTRMYGEAAKWRFRGHAEVPFWRWVTSWARACRKPSDLGFDNGAFSLTQLITREHIVTPSRLADGMLFNLPASRLPEQREEKRRSIEDRCGRAAEIAATNPDQTLIWCQLNAEGDCLQQMIPESVQVAGSDSDERKESVFLAFAAGEIKTLITKPKIGAWGMNWQNCHRIIYFPWHSYEQYYQSIRRCWRFGQTHDVVVDIILTEGERLIMKNLERKHAAAVAMFQHLIGEMNNAIGVPRGIAHTIQEEVPSWL